MSHTKSGLTRRPLPFHSLALASILVLGGAVALRGLLDRGNGAPSAPRPSAVSSANAQARPRNSPSPEPERSTPRGKLVIHGTGDVNLDPTYIPNLRTYGYGYAWSGLDGLFRRDDLTVVNLECPVSRLGSPAGKEFTFRGDPAALPAMRRAGVEVANLGNNHSQDFGPEAMLDTRKSLSSAGIRPVGAGRNAAQAEAPAILRMNGWKVGVVGFGGVVPSPDWLAGPNHPGMANGDDIPTMVRAVRSADRLADLVIVVIHWGVELDTTPRPEDVQRAHAMIDAGADAIFGHHPHRLQPMGSYKGRPIFYSLGNFVWPSFSVAGSTTAVAEVTVSAKGRIRGRLIPAYIQASGHPVLRGS